MSTARELLNEVADWIEPAIGGSRRAAALRTLAARLDAEIMNADIACAGVGWSDARDTLARIDADIGGTET